MIHKGIDIVGAYPPDKLNYAELKKEGVDFAIIKVSEGDWWDKAVHWREHAEKFRAAGIKVGFYLYSEAKSVEYVRKETQFFLRQLGGYKPDIGCWWDIESEYAYSLAQQGIGIACLKAFAEIISAAGMEWGVYTNLKNNLKPLFGSYQAVKDLGGYVWVANYPVNGAGWELGLPSKANTCDIWQQTEKGQLKGAPGIVMDLSVCYETKWWEGKSMNENQIRQKVVDAARMYLGVNEKDGSYMDILRLYNGHKPLARGYEVQSNDEWCAAFTSAVAIKAGMTDIMPTEVGANEMLKLYQQRNRFVEDDNYLPKPGDIIFYDWQDSGSGDNTGYADHVGIVESVTGSTITVIEGNISESVGRRTINRNAKYIRGYGVPDYASKVTVDYGDPSEWARESCRKAVAKGVFHGDGDGSFRWHDGITREELAVVLDNVGLLG